MEQIPYNSKMESKSATEENRASFAESADSSEDSTEQDLNKEKDGKKERTDVGVAAKTSTTSTISPKQRNCCYRFWNAIFKFFAKDAIYGSFVGPHPVSFLFCCCPVICKTACIRPFILASIATKLMWFIMLVIILLLSCILIIPYSQDAGLLANIAEFFPCNVTEMGLQYCKIHGGYLMVYRNIFAYNLLLLISCVIMINVKSTGKNRKRAKMHHGFWMYKYIILFGFLLVAYLAIWVWDGIFEYAWSWIGLIAGIVFSFVEITFILDLVQLFCETNRISKSDWADFGYWFFFSFVLLIDCLIIAMQCSLYTMKHSDGKVEWSHVGIIIYGIVLVLFLLIIGIFNCRRKVKIQRLQFTGPLQTVFVVMYICIQIWIALGNSPVYDARPDRNFHGVYERQDGSKDIYFSPGACTQGLISLFALVYYIFFHAPISKTAPMSILFDKVVYYKAKKSEVPVIPDPEDPEEAGNKRGSKSSKRGSTVSKQGERKDSVNSNSVKIELPAEASATENETLMATATTAEKETQKDEGDLKSQFKEALSNRKLLDDEKAEVRYSWALFYVVMMLGSLSIMMAMTNFSDPWEKDINFSSSYPAMGVKLFVAVLITILYTWITTAPCPKIFPEIAPPAQPPISPDIADVEKDVEKGNENQIDE